MLTLVTAAVPVQAQTKTEQTSKSPDDVPKHDPPVTKAVNRAIGEGGNNTGFDMAPETTLKVVQAAVKGLPTKVPAGPFQPTWESLERSKTKGRSIRRPNVN